VAPSLFEMEKQSKIRDIGNTSAHETISLQWEFTREIWEDCNKRLHDPSLEDCHKM